MNINELKPGMLVRDYNDYLFVVEIVHVLSEDEFGPYHQVNTHCGNVVFYRPEHWDKFTIEEDNGV